MRQNGALSVSLEAAEKKEKKFQSIAVGRRELSTST